MGGIMFIMETAQMVVLILNSIALAFILDIDEVVMSRLSTKATLHIMEHLHDYELFDLSEEEKETEEHALEHFAKEEANWNIFNPKVQFLLLPKRLLIMIAILSLVDIAYFLRHCSHQNDGSWISKPVRRPIFLRYNPLRLALPGVFGDQPLEKDAAWEMPDVTDSTT